MAYNDNGRRPRSGAGSRGGSSRSHGPGQRLQVPGQGTYHGPRGTTQRPRPARRSSGPGYPLRARNINFQSGKARRISSNRRLLILGALALVLLILVIVGVSSCVSSCSNQQTSAENPVDARVAAGVSEDLTQRFAEKLDEGEKLAEIAANADKYENQALLELALSQPTAIDFVAAYPEAEKTTQPYGEEAAKGTVPELYCWDARWGNVDYAGEPLALTGSGPTSLSMAYIGLTGNTDRTAADLAALIEGADLATGDSLMSGTFLTDQVGELGLTCSTYASNTDNLLQILDTGTYLLVEAPAGTLTDEAHWIVVVTEEADGSVTVYDPTSPAVSAHPWDPATIAGLNETLYALTAAE